MNNHRKRDSARLIWDTKPKRAPNPKDIEFQTAEVVVPNPEHRGQLPMSFTDGKIGEEKLDKQKMNRLIWGDNLLAMQALLNQGYEGKINLIYIDPPFDSKADYSHKIKLSSVIHAQAEIQNLEITKEPSVIERLAYKDTWAGGTDSYLDMLYPRLQLMKRLLAPNGSIFVHLDYHVGHYVKVMMDEIFGENFLNEIIWHYRTYQGQVKGYFPRKHDVIFWYFNKERPPFKLAYSEEYKHTVDYKRWGSYIVNEDEIKGDNYPSTDSRFMAYYNRWVEEHGRQPEKDDVILKLKGYVVDDVWMDIQAIDPKDLDEKLGYTTQKPETLPQRIIESCTQENDLIVDFFSGSGTTISVAEKLNRRWIGCELGKVGIQVARGRLVEQKAKPFLVENIGNYQREMIYLGGGRIYEMQKIVLKLYGAEIMDNRKDLGVKKSEDGKMELVYCGYPDRPIAAHKAEELAKEAENLQGGGFAGLTILGWDYEYNFDELLNERKELSNIKLDITAKQIPLDIYEYLKQAKSEDDLEPLIGKVVFFNKPYLKIAKPEIAGMKLKIQIENYVVEDFPLGSGKKADESRAELMVLIKNNFAVLIDYWAVDWDYDGHTFKSLYQELRGNGRKTKLVRTEAENTYQEIGKKKVAVRVVDIFGNDATKILEVEI